MIHPACSVLCRLAVAALLLAPVPALAQPAQPTSADTARLEQRLEQSLRLIEALNSRVEQLEKQLAAQRAPAAAVAAPVAPSAPETTAARLAEVERTVNQLTASGSRDLRDSGLVIHGFADVGFSALRNPPPGQRSGFAVGSVDFYLTPELGPNVKTLIELNFGLSSDGHTEADLERAQIGYAFSDALTLWLGRFHTPFGYWNVAFHHGAQIQTSVMRPRLLNPEDRGGILPVHTIGLWGTGGLRTGAGRLVYNLYLGNGTRISNGSLDPNSAGDDSGSKLLGFSLGQRFAGTLDGLTVGVHGLRQTVSAYDAGNSLTGRSRVAMLGGYGVYDNHGWEAIAEYYHFRNTNLSSTGTSHGSWAGYAQLGHAFQERWVPYYRFEKAELDPSDTYFLSLANGRSYSRHVLGLRFNAEARAALKFELNSTRDQGLGRTLDELRLQYAVSF